MKVKQLFPIFAMALVGTACTQKETAGIGIHVENMNQEVAQEQTSISMLVVAGLRTIH